MGSSFTPVQLSTWERVQLIYLVPFLLIKVIVACLQDILISRDFRSKTILRTFVKNIGQNSSILSFRQARSAQKPSGVTISNCCSREGLQHHSIRLDAGNFPSATLHFIGCTLEDKDKILLYFHGGGYIQAMVEGHFKLARMTAQVTGSNLVMLEYTLAPELKYPGQLAQAAAALRFLLQNHAPNQVIIGGDSAGGNLTLALLAHLRQPHPRIEPVQRFLGESSALRAAFCISPRCANDSIAASFTRNATKDIITARTTKLFISNWQPVEKEVWATPVHGSEDFWSIISAERFMLAVGGNEVYFDDIMRFADIVGAQTGPGARRQLLICPGEIHVQCGIDLVLGIDEGIMLTKVMDWLRSNG